MSPQYDEMYCVQNFMLNIVKNDFEKGSKIVALVLKKQHNIVNGFFA